jgi:hypothetical protein
MANFYGQYIGYGGGGETTPALAGWYGTRGVVMAGYYPNRDTIDYITIATPSATALDFGNCITAVRGAATMGNGIGGRGMCVGGSTDSGQGNGGASSMPGLQYITFSSTGDATYFGDLLVGAYFPCGAGNDGIRGMKYGGEGGSPYYNPSIDYSTIATTGNALDFGDAVTPGGRGSSVNDGTTSIQAGISNYPTKDINIEYVTTQTTGNAVDWGYDFTAAWINGDATSSDSGRGVFHTPDTAAGTGLVTMEYITIQTPADSLDYGDLLGSRSHTIGKLSNGTRGCIAGGYPSNTAIDYFTFASTGNGIDFGNLSVGRSMCGGISGT